MNRHSILQALHSRFTYMGDYGGDDWVFPWSDYKPVKGDCEDFATQLLYDLVDHSTFRFWFALITLQAVIWHVKTPKGNRHAVLWYRGRWADNTMPTWYRTRDMPHRRVFPYPVPTVVLKFFLRK